MESALKGFRCAGVAGVLIILSSFLVSHYYPMEAATSHSDLRAPIPIIALEFSASLPQAASLLGEDSQLIRTFDIGHHLDLVFALIYAAFLGFANVGAWHSERRSTNVFGMISAAFACTADWAENWLLLQLTDALLGVGAAPDFWLLRLFASTKFLCISISMLCLCPYLWNKGALARAYCLAAFALPLATFLTVLGMMSFSNLMVLLTSVAWLLLLIIVLRARRFCHEKSATELPPVDTLPEMMPEPRASHYVTASETGIQNP